MDSAETPSSVIARFAAFLETAGVPYTLTGSFASGIHGQPRASHDIDFVIAPTLGPLNRLLALLPESQFYVSREAALDACGRESLFNVVDMNSGWKVDFICRQSRQFSLTEFDRRQMQEIEGRQVYVTSAEDALLSKLEWAKLTESLTERFHQGLGGQLIKPPALASNDNATVGPIRCRSRLGGLLNDYHREAAWRPAMGFWTLRVRRCEGLWATYPPTTTKPTKCIHVRAVSD